MYVVTVLVFHVSCYAVVHIVPFGSCHQSMLCCVYGMSFYVLPLPFAGRTRLLTVPAVGVLWSCHALNQHTC